MTETSLTNSAGPPSTQQETLYPDRDVVFGKLTLAEKNDGNYNFDFLKNFRQTPYHENYSLSRTHERSLDPPRETVISYLKVIASDFSFPQCFSINGDLVPIVKDSKHKEISMEDHFSFKNPVIEETESDNGEEEQDSEGGVKANDEEPSEDEVGEYNPADYIDHDEDGDFDEDSDDGSD